MTVTSDDCPDHYAAMGYSSVAPDAAVDCHNCDSKMTVAKPLDGESLDTQATIAAYRCLNCTAIDFVAKATDVDPLADLSVKQLAMAADKGIRTEGQR